MRKIVFKPWLQTTLFIIIFVLLASDNNDMSKFISAKLVGILLTILLIRFSNIT